MRHEKVQKNKINKIENCILIFEVSVIMFIILHELGNLERGYNAIGGEIFAFTLPIFVWLGLKIKKFLKSF